MSDPKIWRSIRGNGPYEVIDLTGCDWVLRTPEADRAKYGIYPLELAAVERAIRDNQRFARKIKDRIAALKVRRASLKAHPVSAPTGQEAAGEMGE